MVQSAGTLPDRWSKGGRQAPLWLASTTMVALALANGILLGTEQRRKQAATEAMPQERTSTMTKLHKVSTVVLAWLRLEGELTRF